MAGNLDRTRRALRWRAAAALATAVCLSLAAGGGAQGAAIRRHQIHATAAAASGGLNNAWGAFLAGGPALWSQRHAPAFPSNLRLATVQGQLLETPFVHYLSWRRALSPARFDHYHPHLGPALGLLVPPLPTTTPPTPPGNPQGQGISVPEPGMWSVALLTLAAGWGWKARSRGRSVRPS